MNQGKCALCNQVSELQLSHVIPRFAIKWIKKTSATNITRDYQGKRKQDAYKKYLLCRKCEEKFSKFESYFASHIFHKLIQEKITSPVEYDKRLGDFIISISWRFLFDYIEEQKNEGNVISENLRTYLEKSSNYLNNKNDSLDYGIYLIPWGKPTEESKTKLQRKFEWYTLRAGDLTYARDKSESIQFIFCQLPYFSLVAAINPKYINGFENVQIKETGLFNPVFKIEDRINFLDFLESRVRIIDDIQLEESEMQKISDKMLQDFDKTKGSYSYRVMPRSIKEFLEKEKQKK